MAPYFAHNALTVTLSAVTLLTWQVFELRQSLRRRPDAHLTDHGSNRLLRGVAAVGWLMAALATARLSGTAIAGQPAAFVAGLVVAWVGLWLRVWAFRTLGEYFTFHVQTSEDQPVITTGPYRFVRHPSYSGLELIFVGVGLLYGNWLGLAALAILPMVALVYRIRIEERALEAELGEAYRSFASTRARMVPYVW
jgi:protein-S-isoprenylcysteine O-methyltransferase Ste14